jgi:hypothetical protein
VAELPQVKQHLEQCRVCREEYEILRELRYLDEDREMQFIYELQDLSR